MTDESSTTLAPETAASLDASLEVEEEEPVTRSPSKSGKGKSGDGTDPSPKLRRRPSQQPKAQPATRPTADDNSAPVVKGGRAQAEEYAKAMRWNKKLQRLLTEVSSERDAVQFSIRDMKKEHKKEIEQVQHEIGVAQERTRQMAAKLEKLPAMERYIVDMYMEFRDSPFEPDASQEEVTKIIEKERQALKAQSPLVTLDYLKGNVRNLLSSKEDQESDLKGIIGRKAQEKDVAVSAAQEEIQQLRQQMHTATQLTTDATSIQTKLEVEKEKMRSDLDAQIADHQRQLREVQTQLQRKDRDMESLQESLSLRNDILLAKETRLVRVTQLERQIWRDQRRHRLETDNLKAQSIKQRQQLEKESATFEKTQRENTVLERQLKELRRQLHDTRVSANRTHVMENERRARHAEELMRNQSKSLHSVEKELAACKAANEELRRQNANMKEEYKRIFEAAQKEQEKRAADDKRALVTASERRFKGSENLLKVGDLKERLEAKERECQVLSNKLKRLILHQHRDLKYHELERNTLMEELKDVQMLNEELGGSPPKVVIVDRRQFMRQPRGDSTTMPPLDDDERRASAVRHEDDDHILIDAETAELLANADLTGYQDPTLAPSPRRPLSAEPTPSSTMVDPGYRSMFAPGQRQQSTHTGHLALIPENRRKGSRGTSLAVTHSTLPPANLHDTI